MDENMARGFARVFGPERLMHAAAGDPELDAATAAVLAFAGGLTGETHEVPDGGGAAGLAWDADGTFRLELPG